MNKALLSPNTVIGLLRDADDAWEAAVQGLERYPERLRAFAAAANHQSRALTAADLANIEWKSRPGASQAPPPPEVDEQSGRPGAPADWTAFDQALHELGVAYEGTSIKAVIAAYAVLAEASAELADALEAAEASRPRRRRAG